MDFETLKYFLVVFVMTSWPVWLVGGLMCVFLWPASKTWHPLVRLLARTCLLALTLTPSYLPACMPAFVPAVLVFIHETPDEWVSHGLMPLFFGWLVIFSIPVAIVVFRKICDRPFP